MKKRIVNLVALLLAVAGVSAQSFTHSLDLPKVDSSGYYQIELPVELFSICKKNRGDIRIYEASTKNQNPYILQTSDNADLRFINVTIPVDFEVKNKQKNRYEIFIPPFDKISYSELRFKYSPTNKPINKVGVVVLPLLDYKGSTYTEGVKTAMEIHPFNDTSFTISHGTLLRGQATRIVFDNVDTDFAITGITYQRRVENYDVLTKISNLEWEMTENATQKTSIIKGSFPINMPIQKMEIEIDSTGYYNRHGSLQLYTEKPRNLFDDNHRSSFSLDFNQGNKISVDAGNNIVNRFLITINNKDNKPLPIKSITAYASKLYAITRLEAGKQYVLMAGNSSLKLPQYDWDYSAKVPKDHHIVANATLQPTEQNGNTNSILLWSAVGLCVLVMGGMAFSMIKRTNVE